MSSLALTTSEREVLKRDLAAAPYDLAGAQEDFSWMCDEVARQVAGLPVELSASVRSSVLEEFTDLAEVLGVGEVVEISSIRYCSGDCSFEVEICTGEGFEASPYVEHTLEDFPRWVENMSRHWCPILMALRRKPTTWKESRTMMLTPPGEYATQRLNYLMGYKREYYRDLCDTGRLTEHLEGMDEYCRAEELRTAEWKANQIRQKDPFLEECDPRSFRGLVNNALLTCKQELMREVVMA